MPDGSTETWVASTLEKATAAPLDGTEIFRLIRGGASLQATSANLKTYANDILLAGTNTWTGFNAFSHASGIRLSSGDNRFDIKGRTVTSFGVCHVRSVKANSPTAWDVTPNGNGGAETAGKAWIHVLNSDLEADPDNWEGCIISARSDGMHVGSDASGTGTVRPFYISGSTINFVDDFLGTNLGAVGTPGFYFGNTATPFALWWTSGARMVPSYPLSWYSSTDLYSGAADLTLGRAGAAKLRMGAADAASPVAQTLSVQNVVAGTSNTAGAAFTIAGSQGTGSGAGGAINFQIAPAGSSGSAQNALATAWQVSIAGHLLCPTDNTYDIGADGATRPRNVYVAGLVTAGGNVNSGNAVTLANPGVGLVLGSRGSLVAPADGVFTVLDTAGTSFGRLQLGGTTSSFPALKRSGANLQIRTADDGGFTFAFAEGFVSNSATGFYVGTSDGPRIISGSGSPEGAVTAPIGSIYMNTAGGTDTTLYSKNSGAGNTGWVAIDNV